MFKHKKIKNFFGMDNKYIPLTPKLDFIKECEDKIFLINNNFNCLLKRSKEQMLLDKIKEEMLKKQSIDYEKIEREKRLRLEQKKKKLAKRHQLILSSYNNKMILDMILSNKKFIRYITEQQKKRFKNIKTETDLVNQNGLIISNKNINTLENNKDYNQNNKIFKSINDFKNKTYNINSEYYSTQNTEMNTLYNNETNSNNGQYPFKINKNISFPLSSSIFKTAIPMENTKYSQTPKKSVLYLRKNKNINEKHKVNPYKEPLITEINNNNSYNNFINNNKKFSAQKYKPFIMNNNEENKGFKNLLTNNNINLNIDEKKNCHKKASSYSINMTPVVKKMRPLTSLKSYKNKS